MTWAEAQAHCQARGARLPSEAEWEYAARGPDGLIYPWGDAFVGGNVTHQTSQTAAVGSKPGGASWVGAQDLSGNVWEWVADWYAGGYYGTLTDGVVNPQGPDTGDSRGLRGGSWYYYAFNLRAAYRNRNYPGGRNGIGGFRCARSY